MLSMILGTLGWGVWWLTLVLMKLAPGIAPGVSTAATISVLFALPGLALALFTIRARRVWLLLALAPIFANGSLLLVPSLVNSLGIQATAPEDSAGD
jgi:hypothetical protein